jgi:hypothetical protein
MASETAYWLLILIGLFVSMFVIIPPTVGPRISHVGFYMGFVQAIFWLWLLQSYLKVFRIVGDPTVFGVPIITTIAWVPPSILFAYYFTNLHTFVERAALVLFFASGAALITYIVDTAGLWENIRWSPFHSFFLATFTHILISIYILKTRNKVKT